MPMNRPELLEELKENPRKVRFARLCKIAEVLGFQARKGTGSHRVYFRDGVQEILNFQKEDGWAKAYQVQQFTKLLRNTAFLRIDVRN